MQKYNYLKRKKVTGKEVLKVVSMLNKYKIRFSKTVYDIPLYPSEKDKFEMNYSLAREVAVRLVLNMFVEEFKINSKSRTNHKFLEKTFSGALLYTIATNIYSLYEYNYLNAMLLVDDVKYARDKKMHCTNLYSKAENEVFVEQYLFQLEALNELSCILFGEDMESARYPIMPTTGFYYREVYELHSSFISPLKKYPIWSLVNYYEAEEFMRNGGIPPQ